MTNPIKKLIPQKAINLTWHLPKAVKANIQYGFPAKKMTVIGVTGTDGKTTTVNMIYNIFKAAGRKVSMISTIYAEIAGEKIDTGFHVTSPKASDVQKFIKKAQKAGTEIMVLEVTSHALDQHRFWGVHFDIGVITNVTHEHLDYHKTWENYLKAKARLIKNVKYAVLNIDDKKSYKLLHKKTSGKVITFGTERKADFNHFNTKLSLKLPGKYNLLNALAAIAVTNLLKIDPKISKKALESMTSLPGRMEEVKNNKGLKIYVDFAHTPNGLLNALEALKVIKNGGKIISLIGAEGYRDVGKRARMGEIATKLSDNVIITSVDPRGLIEKINEQIMDGVKREKGVLNKNIFIEDDRAKAIDLAINKLAKKGDIVAIFGKGHENSMNLDGKKEIPWSDKEAVLKALNS